jgi:hypothetical protein
VHAHLRLNLLTRRVVKRANETNFIPVISERIPVVKFSGDNIPKNIAGDFTKLDQ